MNKRFFHLNQIFKLFLISIGNKAVQTLWTTYTFKTPLRSHDLLLLASHWPVMAKALCSAECVLDCSEWKLATRSTHSLNLQYSIRIPGHTLLKSRLSCLPEPWYPPWDRKSFTCSWTCSSSRCQQFSSSTLAPAVGSGAPETQHTVGLCCCSEVHQVFPHSQSLYTNICTFFHLKIMLVNLCFSVF